MNVLIELLLVLVAAGVATAVVQYFSKTKDNKQDALGRPVLTSSEDDT
jgi:hypothetical protein